MPVHTNYTSEIADQLNEYREKGRKEAAAHRPATDSTRMDQNEAALQAHAEKWLSSEQRLFDAVLTETAQGLQDTKAKTLDLHNRINQLLSDSPLQGEIEASMSGDRNDLINVTVKRMKHEVDWKHFRAKHGITEQAHYPDSRIFHLAIIAVLALIETGINAFFYENAQGLFGGATVALGVAFVNMVGALLLGFGFRFKNLATLESKFLGWTCLVAFLILTVYCNALFSAFRAEYQLLADPTDVAQVRQGFTLAAGEAKQIFFFNMHFADLTSFVLFAFGIVLSLLAFYKGYTLDDKYPGYGKFDRILKEAHKADMEKQGILRQKIKDHLHHKKAAVQGTMQEPTQLMNMASRRIADLDMAHATLNNQAQAIQRDFALVLRAYRNENAAIRATNPPDYFREIPNLLSHVDGSAAAEKISQLKLAQEDLKDLRDRHQDSLNALLQRMHNDSAAILTHTVDRFFKDVVEEAQDVINKEVPTIHRAVADKTNA